jgi:eukaryotic-like serine/threonine-protein kinase
MRCMACGGEMRLIAVEPDRELETPGYEHHSYKCADCGEEETRLAFSREPTQIPPRNREPKQLPRSEPSSPPAPVAAPPVESHPVPDPVPPASLAQEPPTPSITATARSAWETAVARLRSRQNALSEEAETAKKAENLAQFDREWETLAPKRKPSIAAQLAGREPIPAKPAKRTAPPTRPANSGLWARAVAKLRTVEDGSER